MIDLAYNSMGINTSTLPNIAQSWVRRWQLERILGDTRSDRPFESTRPRRRLRYRRWWIGSSLPGFFAACGSYWSGFRPIFWVLFGGLPGSADCGPTGPASMRASESPSVRNGTESFSPRRAITGFLALVLLNKSEPLLHHRCLLPAHTSLFGHRRKNVSDVGGFVC
jgi:hypothetical protein